MFRASPYHLEMHRKASLGTEQCWSIRAQANAKQRSTVAVASDSAMGATMRQEADTTKLRIRVVGLAVQLLLRV